MFGFEPLAKSCDGRLKIASRTNGLGLDVKTFGCPEVGVTEDRGGGPHMIGVLNCLAGGEAVPKQMRC